MQELAFIFLALIPLLSRNASSCFYQHNIISFRCILKNMLAAFGCRKDSTSLKKAYSFSPEWDPLDCTVRVWAQPPTKHPWSAQSYQEKGGGNKQCTSPTGWKQKVQLLPWSHWGRHTSRCPVLPCQGRGSQRDDLRATTVKEPWCD